MLLTDEFKGDTITVDNKQETRCPSCNRLFFKGKIIAGAFEIQCPRCKNKIKIKVM